jgi:hypothetical protein
MSGLGTTQSLKSALQTRVREDRASRLGSQRQNLGEAMMCPASSQNIQFDIFGRPVNQNTLLLDDSACSNYTIFPARRRIEVENMERPYIPICAAGNRGAGDFMGAGRDLLPQNIYGDGYGGNMIRHYDTANNSPPEAPEPAPKNYYQRRIQPFDFSMDASSVSVYRG